ncbi:MAG: hypothetical protein ACK5PR_00635 [bacterium]|jgi:hypothetical protein
MSKWKKPKDYKDLTGSSLWYDKKPKGLANEVRKAADIVMQAFHWSQTEKGHDYWSGVHDNLLSIANVFESYGKDEDDSELKMQVELNGKKYKLVEME